MAFEQFFNWCEAALWMIMGVLAFARGLRCARQTRTTSRLHLIAAPTLLLFGISDLIEVHTGAWWSPWWLLLWKGGCLVTLAACGLTLLRGRAQRSR